MRRAALGALSGRNAGFFFSGATGSMPKPAVDLLTTILSSAKRYLSPFPIFYFPLTVSWPPWTIRRSLHNRTNLGTAHTTLTYASRSIVHFPVRPQRLSSLVDDILDMAKFNDTGRKGGSVLSLKSVDLYRVVHEVLSICRPSVPSALIYIHTHCVHVCIQHTYIHT